MKLGQNKIWALIILQVLCLGKCYPDTMGTKLAITCAEWTYKSSQHSSEIVLNAYEYHLDSAAAKGFQSTHTKDRNSLRHDKSLKQASKHFQWNCLILGHKEMKWLVWRGLNLHGFSHHRNFLSKQNNGCLTSCFFICTLRGCGN